MMKTLFLTAVLLVSSASAFAMPEGTFSCDSKDGKVSFSSEIANYGTQNLFNLDGLKVDGKDVDLSKKKNLISRQWVDSEIANIQLTLSPDGNFSRILVIETKAIHNNEYTGTAKVQVQPNDFTDAYKTISTSTITCVWQP